MRKIGVGNAFDGDAEFPQRLHQTDLEGAVNDIGVSIALFSVLETRGNAFNHSIILEGKQTGQH